MAGFKKSTPSAPLRFLEMDELSMVSGGDGSSDPPPPPPPTDPASSSDTSADNVQKKHVANIKWTPAKA